MVGWFKKDRYIQEIGDSMLADVAIIYGFIASFIYSIENLVPRFLKRLDVLSMTLFRELIVLIPLSFFYYDAFDSIAVKLILVGIFTSFLPYYLFLKGLRIGKIGIVSVFSQTHSLFAALFSFLLFGRSISYKLGFAILLVIIGMVVFNIKDFDMRNINAGALYGLVAGAIWGLQAVILKHYFADVSVGKMLYFTEMGLFIAACAYLLIGKNEITVPKTSKEWGLLAFMAYGIVIALYAYLKSITLASHPAIPLLVLSSISVMSTLWAYLLFGEKLNKIEIAGMVVVMVAIITAGL